MGRMKYVQRRANRFEFRFPLPDDLAGKPVPAPWPEALAPSSTLEPVGSKLN